MSISTTDLNDLVNAMFEDGSSPTDRQLEVVGDRFRQLDPADQLQYFKLLLVRNPRKARHWGTLASILFDFGRQFRWWQPYTFLFLKQHWERGRAESGLGEQMVKCLRELTIDERR